MPEKTARGSRGTRREFDCRSAHAERFRDARTGATNSDQIGFCLVPIARDRCRRKLLGAAGVLEENSIVVPHTQKDSATLARELLIQIVVEPFGRPPG